jgi:hypothetical protein
MTMHFWFSRLLRYELCIAFYALQDPAVTKVQPGRLATQITGQGHKRNWIGG